MSSASSASSGGGSTFAGGDDGGASSPDGGAPALLSRALHVFASVLRAIGSSPLAHSCPSALGGGFAAPADAWSARVKAMCLRAESGINAR